MAEHFFHCSHEMPKEERWNPTRTPIFWDRRLVCIRERFKLNSSIVCLVSLFFQRLCISYVSYTLPKEEKRDYHDWQTCEWMYSSLFTFVLFHDTLSVTYVIKCQKQTEELKIWRIWREVPVYYLVTFPVFCRHEKLSQNRWSASQDSNLEPPE